MTNLSPPTIESKPKINWTPYLFLLPALFILGLTVFIPALQAFYLSFTKYNPIDGTAIWQGMVNFDRLWRDEIFWLTVRNTILYLIIVVPTLIILPLLLAILVDRPLRGIGLFRAAYYLPVLVSMVVAGIAWKFIYAEQGLLDRLLQVIGIGNIPWLTSPNLSLFSVAIVTIWKGLGYYMTIYLAGLQSIPSDLYEAAAIDGSDKFAKHWDITLPLMRPYMFLVGIVSAISATKIFEEVYVMTQGGPLNSSKTIVYYLYQQGFDGNNLSYACTIGLVLFLAIFILSIVNLKLSGTK
jgi:putative chitobiose transport system permease protein